MSNLQKIIEILKHRKKENKTFNYFIPKIWNISNYSIIKEEKNQIQINPYKFLLECIENDILPYREKDKNYSQSLSQTLDIKPNKNERAGEWMRNASMYSLLIRNATAWDHANDGVLEDTENFTENGTFLKTLLLLPLMKRLKLNTLYLLPLTKYSDKFKKGEIGSPYAIKNFLELDPHQHDKLLGNEISINEEFAALVEAAHILGIRVTLDFIPRTSGRDSDW